MAGRDQTPLARFEGLVIPLHLCREPREYYFCTVPLRRASRPPHDPSVPTLKFPRGLYPSRRVLKEQQSKHPFFLFYLVGRRIDLPESVTPIR